MSKHEYLDTLPSYAIGALSESSRQKIEAHLESGCEVCREELQVLALTVSRMPSALRNQPMPAGLKDRLRLRIEREFPPNRQAEAPAIIKTDFQKAASSRSSALTSWLAAAAAVILLVAGAMYRREASNLKVSLADRDTQIAQLQKDLASQKHEITWLRDPAVQLAMLSGLDLAPGAKARMIWNPVQSKGILYVQSLPALKADRSYQLWIIGDKGPVSGGIVEPDASGRGVLTITQIQGSPRGNLQFAVTIEPHGGVPQPTGSMVLAGKPI